jgi:hypothetical protein
MRKRSPPLDLPSHQSSLLHPSSNQEAQMAMTVADNEALELSELSDDDSVVDKSETDNVGSGGSAVPLRTSRPPQHCPVPNTKAALVVPPPCPCWSTSKPEYPLEIVPYDPGNIVFNFDRNLRRDGSSEEDGGFRLTLEQEVERTLTLEDRGWSMRGSRGLFTRIELARRETP